MFSEARLEVALSVRGGTVAEVRIRSSRLVQASKLFAGRTPGEVTKLLPTLFALCGTAQVLAGMGAMERAGKLEVEAAHLPARRLMALAEMVSEHGLGMARDWPALVGATPDLTAAKRIKTAMSVVRGALYPTGDWNRPGGGTLDPQRERLIPALAAAKGALTELLGVDAHAALNDLPAFLAGPYTPAARLLAEAGALADFGAAAFLPMPECPDDLPTRLAEDADGAYLARPDCAGTVFETGPLARMAWHPAVRAVMARHGAGLLARLVARVAELASALHEMAELMQDLKPAPACDMALADGAGIGLVEAARGLLAHRAELEGGIVTRYQILAPTEWNFHPQGPLARGLKGAAAADIERRAALLVHALDPCVACKILVE